MSMKRRLLMVSRLEGELSNFAVVLSSNVETRPSGLLLYLFISAVY